MANVRVEMNLQGVNEVMRSSGVEADLRARAERIARRAGEGFGVESNKPHRWVARAWAQTESRVAERAEARDNVLTRAIDAGRD